jgi:arylsulfatase A-like enzyme
MDTWSEVPPSLPQPPNIVLVVLDCARADDFPGTRTAPLRLPFVERLLREGEYYPNAAAVAPWTVPSHATMFTGLYPWEHGCHAKGDLKLRADCPRLSSALSSAGYRTFSLSANHLICDDLGLSRGFDERAWAGWWEPYLRIGGVARPPNVPSAAGIMERGPPLLRRAGPLWGMIKRTSRLVYRYPFVMDGAGRLITAMRDGQEGSRLVPVSPWIEPTLRRWLERTPSGSPIFTFINLLETHEPYYPDPDYAPDLARWWRYSRTRQDHVGWLSGEWLPSQAQYQDLRRLYQRTFLAADRRLENIVQLLQEFGRWENTLFILTSDHGQAFGEEGMFFHMLRLPEALVRIPLLVRRPRAESGGSRARGWASHVDLAPTILEAAGLSGALPSSGLPLGDLLDQDRIGPVFAAADGLVWRTVVPEHERANFSERRRAEFDRVHACAYEGTDKLVFDSGTGSVRAYDLEHDPIAATDVWDRCASRLEGLAAETRLVARRMSGPHGAAVSADVEDRLRSWGYI